MKKISLIVAVILIAVICFFSRCAKINTDQPCGTYQTNIQLFKDSENKCYYKDQDTGKKVYVDQSICNCY
ncbi:MAG: hypothetical protein ABIN91_20020 [Mucilaginibacter sp.]|uniref:hypothetical protein n=1 Tax=Mucilaginibacter sp. TaxID=1882438 RepID=UPI003265EA2D